MIVSTVLATIVIILVLVWVRHRKYKQSLFKRLGIPGPEPSLIWGNTSGMREKGIRDTTRNWTKQYGKVFGYYEGENPILLVADPELVKQITIKDFAKFHSHKGFAFRKDNDPLDSVFQAQGEKWKRLRSVSSPSFTTGRMKQMSPSINGCVTELIQIFEEKCEKGEAFDIHSEFGRMTLDVIARVAFGIDAGCLSDPQSRFLLEMRKVFQNIENLTLKVKTLIMLSGLFPSLMKKLSKYISGNLAFQGGWAYATAKEMILARQQSNETTNTRPDLINLMLETNKQLREGKIKEVEKETDNSFLNTDTQVLRKQQPMSIEEMQGQVVVFLTAGYETTSTALGFTAYHLALNPNVQRKLQAEIDQHFPEKVIQPDYNQVQKLKYMDNVMKEVLRMSSIAHIATTRTCFEDVQYGDIRIPKGTVVHINMDDLHYNPELWGKYSPETFVPERFEEDCEDTVNTLAWIPFGAGPRICLGMRFANLEYKIALARVLKEFTILRCAETKVPCPTNKNGVYSPSQGVHVKLERRSANE